MHELFVHSFHSTTETSFAVDHAEIMRSRGTQRDRDIGAEIMSVVSFVTLVGTHAHTTYDALCW